MWTNKELKERARASFKANYWKCVFVTWLVGTLAVGGIGASSSVGSGFTSAVAGSTSRSSSGYSSGYSGSYSGGYGSSYSSSAQTGQAMAAFGLMLLVFLLVAAIALTFKAFVTNPLSVGGARFYIDNLSTKAQVRSIGYGYDFNYKETAKAMFYRDLFTLLWSLLFVIPGIVKSLEYAMIPYLLADNPTMTKDEAFAESKRLMDGQKGNLFLLRLSFIGWYLLGTFCTFGLLLPFYVSPYIEQTIATFYVRLRDSKMAETTV